MSHQEPAWELSKENVAPLARGRDKISLHTALHATKDNVTSSRAFHEDAVRKALSGVGPYANDPLTPAASYVKWAADAYQPRSPQLLTVLEAICRSFVSEQRYKNDPRYVRFWVRYADARDDPMDCFAYMKAHGIGKKNALFYEAWATTLEYKKDFPGADRVYASGLECNAEPRKRLEQRQREFLARMVARDRRAEAKASKADMKSSREKSVSARKPVSDASRGSRQQYVSDENARPALGSLTAKQANASFRPVAPQNTSLNSGMPTAFVQATRSTERTQHQSTFADKTGRKKQNEIADFSFRMYSDSDDVSHSIGYAENKNKVDTGKSQENPGFPSLAKFDEVRKENEGDLPSQWAGTTLRQSSPLTRARQRSRRQQTPAFEIFADPVERNTPHNVHQTAEPSLQKPDTADESDSVGAPTGPPSPTINTKIAMQQVDEMFNSPLPFAVRPKTFEKVPNRQKIEIYRDTTEDNGWFTDQKNKPVADGENKVNGVDKENISNQRPAVLHQATDEDQERLPGMPFSSVVSTASSNQLPPDTIDSNKSHRESLKTCTESMTDWCVDCVPDLPGWRPLENNCPELRNGTVITLQCGLDEEQSYIVHALLGVGFEGISRVFAATPLDGLRKASCEDGNNSDDNDDDDDDETTVAIKVASTVNLAWEFYIYNVIHSRLGNIQIASIPHALYFYHGSPHSCLILDKVGVITLANLVDVSRGKLEDESVAMFLAIDLMKLVELLHSIGIIHNDITLENILLRKDAVHNLIDEYSVDGKNGWNGSGVSLIDFNHAVDTRHAAVRGHSTDSILSHAEFMGKSHLDVAYIACKEGDKTHSRDRWGYNVDCICTAACLARLIGCEVINPYGKHEVWRDILPRLHEVDSLSMNDSTTAVLRWCRERLQVTLSEDKDLNSGLRNKLQHLYNVACAAQLANDTT